MMQCQQRHRLVRGGWLAEERYEQPVWASILICQSAKDTSLLQNIGHAVSIPIWIQNAGLAATG